MKTYELQPSEYVNQKSFYHKAKVQELESGIKILVSYSTNVAYIKNGTLYKMSSARSPTTGCHIKAFSDHYATNNPYY